MTTRSFSHRALRVLMVVSVLAGIAQIAAYAALQADWEPGSVLRAAPYGAIAAAIAVCMSLLVANDRRGNVRAARMIARSLVALTLSAFFYDVMFVEDTPLSSVFVFQFVLVVAYQMSNDPNLDRHNPRDGGFRGAIPLSSICFGSSSSAACSGSSAKPSSASFAMVAGSRVQAL